MGRRREGGATGGSIRIEGDDLIVTAVTLHDAELVRYVAEHPAQDHATLVERALRIGLIALRNAGVTLNVDFVAKEFERLLHRADESHEKAAHALDTALRETFADGDGRLPRTLERFLGDRGTLRKLVDDLFDEKRRDSAIGRMRTLLAGYFDGDGAILSRMLDPRREDSPLHGFRAEVRDALKDVGERLVRLEAARDARADERSRGTAKGADFESAVEARLASMTCGTGDVVEPTASAVGNSLRGRKGDFLLTVDPSWTRGLSVRVAIEAKSGRMGLTPLVRELDEARRNRDAAVAVAVYRAGCAPVGCAPFTLHGEHVICELDPDDADDPAFLAAVRLARTLAVAAARGRGDVLDVAAVRCDLDGIRAQLKDIEGVKSTLTSVAGATRGVCETLDGMRRRVLECVTSIESSVIDSGDAHRDVA